ncbi:type II secretion system minor pseudopilin GspI [Pseudomonas sp. TH41]|uniref:type II secretion system minor pseudopilin GspI n=1 Tax=Pseudomonas sp. TH41 TaxID=2796405 RepID=UPI0019135089|nr:type II secretion system minor pseudopilin GspI [Pseudomonas sp. TH41]MBK5352955.1 type II secretion system minor pseudopilin GspI [Pseudomonas sp. TH41]
MANRLLALPQRGFTLLEIMVALAIFSTLTAAVLSASQYVVKQTGAVEERLFAAWLADNLLNELRLQTGLTLGQQQRVVRMDRRDWLLGQHISASPDPRLLKVDIRVTLSGREQTVHRASGWIPNRHE